MAPQGFVEVNVFHLTDLQDPPPLEPDGHYTYAKEESLQMIFDDVQHLCTPSKFDTIAMWLRDAPGADRADGRSINGIS